VIDGALQPDGMVSFAKVLTLQDAEAIRAYVVHNANLAKNAPPPPGPLGGPGGAAPAGAPPAGAQGPAPGVPPAPAATGTLHQ
jgi:hypothetical protein